MATEEQCEIALEQYEQILMQIEGVVGVGIGESDQGCHINLYVNHIDDLPSDVPAILPLEDADGSVVEINVVPVLMGNIRLL